MREQILAVLLLMAGALIVAGVAQFSTGGAFIAGGALLALWSWLVFGEINEDTPE